MLPVVFISKFSSRNLFEGEFSGLNFVNFANKTFDMLYTQYITHCTACPTNNSKLSMV